MPHNERHGSDLLLSKSQEVIGKITHYAAIERHVFRNPKAI